MLFIHHFFFDSRIYSFCQSVSSRANWMESEYPAGISWNVGLSAKNSFHRLFSHASDILLTVVISWTFFPFPAPFMHSKHSEKVSASLKLLNTQISGHKYTSEILNRWVNLLPSSTRQVSSNDPPAYLEGSQTLQYDN